VVSALCVMMLASFAPFAGSTAAQDRDSLRDVLGDLLRGGERDRSTVGPDRGIPFSRDEIQLSFAPLVRETAPAVVNVYASQRAREVRSPFAGDPFFE